MSEAALEKITAEERPAEEAAAEMDRAVFGFWVYLMTDLTMFAALFAAFAVLRGNTFGGPTASQLFDLHTALAETLILLTSSFTCGLAVVAANSGRVRQTIAWFAATFALGASFLAIELGEFSRFAASGAGWQRSAFLSSFFALVGTHGLHITFGLLWMAVAMVMVWRKGLSTFTLSRVTRLSLFWHFLDLVWIFIFTVVYLMGVTL